MPVELPVETGFLCLLAGVDGSVRSITGATEAADTLPSFSGSSLVRSTKAVLLAPRLDRQNVPDSELDIASPISSGFGRLERWFRFKGGRRGLLLRGGSEGEEKSVFAKAARKESSLLAVFADCVGI